MIELRAVSSPFLALGGLAARLPFFFFFR